MASCVLLVGKAVALHAAVYRKTRVRDWRIKQSNKLLHAGDIPYFNGQMR